MKNIFVILLVVAGCSSQGNDPFSPGGKSYVAPGTFTGRWITKTFSANGEETDTTSCTVVITKCDATIDGTFSNDSSKEVLTFHGGHFTSSTDGTIPLYAYGVVGISNLMIADTGVFYFYKGGDSITYGGPRSLPGVFLDINCGRTRY
jgi:hypothetical protein